MKVNIRNKNNINEVPTNIREYCETKFKYQISSSTKTKVKNIKNNKKEKKKCRRRTNWMLRMKKKKGIKREIKELRDLLGEGGERGWNTL